jgi:myo-inositol-1(or 4)-monophosphatase
MLDMVIGTGIPSIAVQDHPTYLAQLAAVMINSAGVRRSGSAALDLAYVASGRFDGFWEKGLKSWDYVAGTLMVRESGGFVTNYAGGERIVGGDEIVAGNETVHRNLLKLLKQPASR